MAESNGGDRRFAAEYPGIPRWVKIFGIVALALVLLVAVVLIGGSALGLHTPMVPGGHWR